MGNASAKSVDFETGLSEPCWQLVMSHLDVISQLNLALVSRRLCNIFKRYARQRYRHLDEQLMRQLSPEQLQQLLQLVGEHVRSYMSYSPGDELDTLYRTHFEIIMRECKQLERFSFYRKLLTPDMAYALIHQLDKLQHLFLRTEATALRSNILAGLATLSQLETLVLRGPELSEHEIEQVCRISSLKELDFRCGSRMPMEHMLQLRQLETLHITMPELENRQLLQLMKGLAGLHTLHINDCPRITEDFVLLSWSRRHKKKIKLRIYVHKSGIDWQRLKQAASEESFLEIINKSHLETEPFQAVSNQLNKLDSFVE